MEEVGDSVAGAKETGGEQGIKRGREVAEAGGQGPRHAGGSCGWNQNECGARSTDVQNLSIHQAGLRAEPGSSGLTSTGGWVDSSSQHSNCQPPEVPVQAPAA